MLPYFYAQTVSHLLAVNMYLIFVVLLALFCTNCKTWTLWAYIQILAYVYN